jgi:hypothetical protein
MFRFGGRRALQGLQQKNAGSRLSCNATAVKVTKGDFQEVLIPVPWGHVAGRIVVQKQHIWDLTIEDEC